MDVHYLDVRDLHPVENPYQHVGKTMPNEADGRIKFFDQSTDLEKSKVPELYSLMSNINGIDKWHKYMANPKPVSPFAPTS